MQTKNKQFLCNRQMIGRNLTNLIHKFPVELEQWKNLKKKNNFEGYVKKEKLMFQNNWKKLQKNLMVLEK